MDCGLAIWKQTTETFFLVTSYQIQEASTLESIIHWNIEPILLFTDHKSRSIMSFYFNFLAGELTLTHIKVLNAWSKAESLIYVIIVGIILFRGKCTALWLCGSITYFNLWMGLFVMGGRGTGSYPHSLLCQFGMEWAIICTGLSNITLGHTAQ